MSQKFNVLIVGGGTAGTTTAAKIIRDHSHRNLSIALVDPSEKHYYQPLWTLVGGGVFPKEDSEKNQADFIPQGVTWIKNKVLSFDPDNNCIKLDNNEDVAYDYLVVCAGIQIDWHKIKGLEETLGKNGVCSNYRYDLCEYTWECIKSVKNGNAVFNQPPMPIKCAGAPQKILYLAHDYYRKNNLLNDVNLEFYLQGPGIFGVAKYKEALEKVLEKKNLKPHYKHNLVEVRGTEKIAIFENVDDGSMVETSFEMIHVVPPMSSPDFIKSSPISNEAGWVDVDKYTTQHTKYNNVFSIGDCSSLPTSRTGAAIRKQVPVLVANLISLMDGKELSAKYNGYASCPLVTSYNTCMLAEFDYDGNPTETFPFNQAKERHSMYYLKAYGLPFLYWKGMLKGRG